MKMIKHFIVFWLVVSLLGCVNFGNSSSNTLSQNFKYIPFTTRQQSLSKLSQFNLQGSFSIQQNGQLPVIANYDWQQQSPQQYHIDINAPLNLVHADISRNQQNVSIHTSQGQTATANSAEMLMGQMLGWSLPISDLWFWVRGLPANTLPLNIYYDQYGHVRMLQQEGWTVHFLQYASISPYLDLPQQILLRRPGITAKIVIKNWNVGYSTL